MSVGIGSPTRRRVLQRTGAIAAAAIIGRACAEAEAPQSGKLLPIPELRDARASGGLIDLVASEGRHAFIAGRPAQTYGYSAPYLGPVLLVHDGDDVQFSVENRLGFDTTAHWHGVLTPAALDGGPHIIIPPGETWRPKLSIRQPETTAWYHAHPHGDSGRQVYMGLAGMMIVKDGTSARLGLPESYGVDDLPIILQDRSLDDDGKPVYAPFGPGLMMGMRGETLLVNGAIAPSAKAPPGVVRLRLLNGANARNFDLAFSDGRTFHVIASDGGYLPAPAAMTRLVIAPAERFEVLVDFSDGKPVQLVTAADTRGMMGTGGGMGPGMGPGMMRGMAGGNAGALMSFTVDPELPAKVKTVPARLVELLSPDPSSAVGRRRISLDMGPGMMGAAGPGMRGMGRGMGPPVGINGQTFDMNRIDFAPKLGSTEIWDVAPTMMAHPFHIHGVIFHVLTIGGAPPPPHLAGGKDTILLDRPAELLMQFTQPATKEAPFMFHCHILEHEDAGMMGQYVTT